MKLGKNSGQAMLLTVLIMTGTVIGATAIAGYLMLSQVRQATDVVNSSKAIFAADTGMEWAFYNFFQLDNQVCPGGAKDYLSERENGTDIMENGSSFTASCSSTSELTTLKSIGDSYDTYRALEAYIAY
ncbi:MAG: hypothetical protein PHN74_00160 [Candidatus Pacebacteria bacterium]|nr:hypothetical protein [Candidatus Paceibacterota bacterium]